MGFDWEELSPEDCDAMHDKKLREHAASTRREENDVSRAD
jgi:hypothetical protein